MAYVSSLKSIWEATDNSYIQTTKSGGRPLVGRGPFPQRKKENLSENRFQRRNDSESDNKSDDSSIRNFDAIPEEFRPSKHGRKDLLKVMTSPKKGDPKEETELKERHQTKPSVAQEKRSFNYSSTNSPTTQGEYRNNEKESLKNTTGFEPVQRGGNLNSYETRKQKKVEDAMFFYYSSFGNDSFAKSARDNQLNFPGEKNGHAKSSYKSELSNMQNESTQNKFFSQSKENNDSPFENNVQEVKNRKYNKNALPSFHDSISNGRNKVSLKEQSIEKITQETTVTKRAQWNNDLCRVKKPGNKPIIFHEYTKTTKQSTYFVSPRSENDDEEMKMPNTGIKNERHFYDNFRRKCFIHHDDGPKLQSESPTYQKFDSTYKPQRERKYVPRRPDKYAKKFEENSNYSHCCKGKDTIIVKHEVKVIHMNGHGNYNRKFHNSFQRFRSPKKDSNCKTPYTDDRGDCCILLDKTERNTMVKTYKEEKKDKRMPLKTDAVSKSKFACNDVSLTTNNGYNEDETTLLEYGREISQLIVGSSIAISTFLDNYEQWKEFRRMTILLFQEFEKNLSQACNGNQGIVGVFEMVGTGCKIVQLVPHPGVSIAAKVIACLSDIVSKMFSSSKSAKSIGTDDFQLRLSLQRDVDATSDIYLCGLQCDLQFQETCTHIEEFHSKIKDGLFEKFVETFETDFLKEMSLLSPKHPEVFYKRLERLYKLLNSGKQSEQGDAFCRAFEDWPDALATVGRLPRRFKTENWDSSPVMKTWEEIYYLLQSDQTALADVLKKVQDCICVLIREQRVVEKYAMELKKQS